MLEDTNSLDGAPLKVQKYVLIWSVMSTIIILQKLKLAWNSGFPGVIKRVHFDNKFSSYFN